MVNDFTECGSGCHPDSKPWPHTMIWGQCAKAFRRYLGGQPVIVEEHGEREGGVAVRRRIIVVDEWEEIDAR